MQMRKIWGVMLDDEFDPRAIADSRPTQFKKSMEGAGLETSMPSAPPAIASTVDASKPRPPTRRNTRA